jgi:methyltransferase-like protein
MSELRFPAHHPQAAYQVVDGQAVIVLADSGQVTILNEIGTFIWQLCDGKHSQEQIVSAVVQEYEVAAEVAAQDAAAFLDQMAELQAIVFV